MSGELILYSYWRSSAAYRVRIALNLKQLPYTMQTVNLLKNGGEQHGAAYLQLNPQGLIPVLQDGERIFRQSLAIIEYLEDAYDGELQLLPSLARDRARVRALAQMIACDIHPLGNQRVLQYLDGEFSTPEVERQRWMQHWIKIGFDALEPLLHDHPAVGLYCEADVPGLADCCLVPQVYNAYRWGLDMQAYPIIQRIHAACMELQAFQQAAPEAQSDAPQQN